MTDGDNKANSPVTKILAENFRPLPSDPTMKTFRPIPSPASADPMTKPPIPIGGTMGGKPASGPFEGSGGTDEARRGNAKSD
jgi:hypothetical protein